MNTDIKIYHFTKPTNDKIFGFIKKISGLNAVLCFDLEDFVKDVLDKRVEKRFHREAVFDTIMRITNSSYNQKIGLRINAFGTGKFYEDIKFLEKFKNELSFECIYLPKINNSNEIKKCFDILKKSKIDFSELIPIIESKKALDNLKEIISSSNAYIKKLAFGHCDYNYDSGNFPFYHQDSEQYWNWINYITDVLNGSNLVFINSPYLYLNAASGFLAMISRLSKITNGTFGQITLSFNQIEQCYFYESDAHLKAACIKIVSTGIDKETYAKMIIGDYENYMSSDRSFSINAERFLISPQEYLAARKYLKESEVCNVS